MQNFFGWLLARMLLNPEQRTTIKNGGAVRIEVPVFALPAWGGWAVMYCSMLWGDDDGERSQTSGDEATA